MGPAAFLTFYSPKKVAKGWFIPIENIWRVITAMDEHDEELIADAIESPFYREICEMSCLRDLNSLPLKHTRGN